MKILSGVLSAVIAVSAVSPALKTLPEVTAETSLKDSGISYKEYVGTINNPAAGYTQTIWPACKPGNTPVYDPSGNIVLFFIDIGAFSSGANEEKKDYDLDEAFFASWRKTFENCRKNGCMIALRFRYDANGKTNPEPETFDQLLHHISQVKDSGLLEEFKDIIAYVESGFVGAWGEQHSGKYTSVRYKAQLLDAMLDCVPSPIPVTVRTPDIFAEWVGIKRSELADYQLDRSSEAARVGLYDDGYMGSDSDLGTYANRAIETAWLGDQTLTSYFGGEFSGNLEWAQKYDTYLPENAITEMYNTHLSYINGNIYQLYKNYTFSAENDITEVRYQPFSDKVSLEKKFDHSAYYGQTVFSFIRDHLGYRFVLRKSELSESVPQGGSLDIHFKVENTGFAGAIPSVRSELILERDGQFMRTGIELSPNEWRSCTTADETIKAKLPDSISEGKWNAYLKLEMGGENKFYQTSLRSIRFANDGVWQAAMGANFLGSFTVTASKEHGTDNFLRSGSFSSDKVYSYSGQIICDGIESFDGEWTDDMLYAENGENKLYMTADDKFLYVKGVIPGEATAPVYNLRIENSETDRSYWIYYCPNGYVYFNNGSYEGCKCKWNGDTVEFAVPFGDTMALAPGTKLRSARLFVQDSDNEWVLIGDAKAENISVPSDFMSYSGEAPIRLGEGEKYTMKPLTLLDECEYQWFRDDAPIDGAVGSEYTMTAQKGASEGKYHVVITASSGVVKDIPMCELLEVKSSVRGDINGDKQTDIADLVLLQNHLLGRTDLTSQQLIIADIDIDSRITSFDAAFLRRIIIAKK